MGDLSPHFSLSEFACAHCGRAEAPPAELLDVLERIRALSGEPLTILSGYRCCEHNSAVGGARYSQHLLARAADIPWGRVTQQDALNAGARGVGEQDGWAIHVDVRSGEVATWTY